MTERNTVGLGFSLAWVVATAVGIVLGFPLVLAYNAVEKSLGLPPLADIIGLDLAGALIGTVLGTLVGLLQWLILRRHISAMNWWKWVGANLAGLALAWGPTDRPRLSFWLSLALLGAVFGTLQWLVLRQHFRQAWWWVLGSTLAWPIVAYGVIHPVTLVIVTWEHGGVGLLLTWVMTGPITGAALLWLLRSRLSKSIAAA